MSLLNIAEEEVRELGTVYGVRWLWLSRWVCGGWSRRTGVTMELVGAVPVGHVG